jgi:hypothetical protein
MAWHGAAWDWTGTFDYPEWFMKDMNLVDTGRRESLVYLIR